MKIARESGLGRFNLRHGNHPGFLLRRDEQSAHCALHMGWDYNLAMIRFVTILTLLAVPQALLAQIPPGDNYDPSKHVNPIITFVQTKDFKPSTYKAAGDLAGIPLMGLSKETGTVESVDVADAGIENVRMGRSTVKVTFYPVVRQTFKLADGPALVLYSFKNPKIPNQNVGPFSEGVPQGRGRDPKDKRLGDVKAPEELEIRGLPAVLFEKDGTLTVAWQEEGVTHTATSTLSRRAFFRILDDLL
jgi:hypothetical protein